MRFGMIGPAYEARSLSADAQRCMNLYYEPAGGQNSKTQAALYGTPGIETFATVTDGPVRALFSSGENGGRVLAIGREKLYDVGTDGSATELGTVANDDSPASIAFSGTQYCIISAGVGYVLEGSTLTQITDAEFPGANRVVFLDGYFIVTEPDEQRFWISGQYDGLSWEGLDFGTAEAAPDDIISHEADGGQLWLLGAERTEIFYNSGAASFPFERISGATIEAGIDAAFSLAKVGQGLMWLGGNFRGRGLVYRSEGYSARRVSTHAVETAIQGYGDNSDAIAFSYQEEGHEFYVLSFPTAQATWVYDLTTGLWHQRSYLEDGTHRHIRQQCHCYAYGKHLVGDRSSNIIYRQSLDIYSDNGEEIRRERRSPHVADELEWLFHSELVVDMETGVGLDGDEQGSDPVLMMRFSDDGGYSWSNERTASIGAIGQRKTRVRFSRLGRSRDRVYEIAITDPVKVCLLDAYLKVEAAA